MVKKTLLSLAVATALTSMVGCNVSSTDKYDNKNQTQTPSGPNATMPAATAATYPLFDPANSQLPIANDIVFGNAEKTDGTAYSDVMPSKVSPVTTALQQLAGFSTVAPLNIEFYSENGLGGALSNATALAAQTIQLIANPLSDTPTILTPADYEARFIEYNEQKYQEGEKKGEDVKPNAAKYALQILPKKPLDPATQYMVILTNGIVDDAGEPIGQSSMHALLSQDNSKGDVIYPSGALIPAAKVVQQWMGGAAAALQGAPVQPVFAYTFRTDDGMSQLKNYAAPATFPKLTAAMQDPDTAKLIMGGLDAPYARDVALIPEANVDALIKGAAVQKVMAENNLDEATATGLVEASGKVGASPATLLDTTDTYTRFIQGQIELPNFLPAAEVSPLADKLWTANDALAGLGITPPKDMDGSTNVTYHFPFPKSVGTNNAPLLITMPSAVDYSAGGTNPAGQNCSGKTEFPVVIYVHGITGSRGNMLPYASALAANCIATVGIDLPLHGVAPKAQDGSENSLLALNVEPSKAALTGSPWGAVAAGAGDAFKNLAERHNNTYQLPTQARTSIVFGENAVGDSGSAFINLQNFGRTRDNLRQGVTDLLNLNASLGNISDALKAQSKAGLDLDNVFVAGHSLGGIVASAFVATNNAAVAANTQLNKIQGLIIANSGGHITKMLENSPAFAPTIVGGLAQSGVMQGTEDFEKFIYIFQSIIDGVDPANTASQFGDIPVQLFTAVGHGVNTPLDPNAQVMPDSTVPVRDYFGVENENPFGYVVGTPSIPLANAYVPTARSYLAGTQAIVEADKLNADSAMAEATYIVANHATFADAGSSMPTAALQGAARANFVDMVTKSVMLINGFVATADTK